MTYWKQQEEPLHAKYCSYQYSTLDSNKSFHRLRESLQKHTTLKLLTCVVYSTVVDYILHDV